MKKDYLFTILLFALSLMTYGQINFPDANFKTALLAYNPTIDTNADGDISSAEAEVVTNLQLNQSNIVDLTGIEDFTNLEILYCNTNNLTTINISNNTKLRVLSLRKNQLISLDISDNTQLEFLDASQNNLTSIDVSNNIELKSIYLGFNNLSNINLSNNDKLNLLSINTNQLIALDVSNNLLLNSLFAQQNSFTSVLDISQNTELKRLTLSGVVNGTDISNNLKLENLAFAFSDLVDLDISNHTEIKQLTCNYNNNFENLDITNNTKLERLSVNNNPLMKNLDVSNNAELKYLGCSSTQIESLDLTNNTKLEDLDCSYTKITTLDTRSCNLTKIRFSGNSNLTTAYLTNQQFITDPELEIEFKNCPILNFICIDDAYVNPVKELFNDPDYTTCNVSNNCDENFYTISGELIYDLANDGCGTEDIGFSNLKFALQSDTEFSEIFPNDLGAYATVAYEGDYYMFPIFENPDYFNIDPEVSFPPTPISLPADGTNVIKDFCITANGIHNDLEISIIPISREARPGFNASYLITYKNKGTTTQSGTVTLEYMDDILTVVSATPSVSTTTSNMLSWSYSDFKPMQSRDIELILNINTPTDSPAVNNGDILSYTATVIGATDETPDDNVALLNQTVVNSYDPNDKICLEGDTIEPDYVGKYLHYMIRFENTGSASAVNITVKDDIDITKLDIKSFLPLKASHPYTTRINNEKEIEFTFSNINLPFDDANNDGYVMFKIKSKSDLVEGDTIDNKAAIYFDFNAPIITDVETVTIKEEVIDEPVFSDYFILSPNPTDKKLKLTPVDTNISVQYITIHDISGRIVGFHNGNKRNFNVKHLYPNTYFMHLHTNKGILVAQFIKIN